MQIVLRLCVVLGFVVAGVSAVLWNSEAQTLPGKPAVRADVNQDGIVDSRDLLLVMQAWKQPVAQPTMTPVPQPTPTAVPTVPPQPAGHPYQGSYTAVIRGDDSGTLSFQVDGDGNFTAAGQLLFGPVTLDGIVALDGNILLRFVASDQTVGIGFGRIQSSGQGSGSWIDITGESGSWTVSRTG